MKSRSVLWLLGAILVGGVAPKSSGAEPGLAGRADVVLSCDFETDDWWKAWGGKLPPLNTSSVDGELAFGGKGRSLRVTVPKDQHTGTSFAYRFRQQLGAEPEEIWFRYYLKFDPDWRQATSGGKLPGISGTYGKAGWGGRPVNGTDGWSARGLFVSKNGGDATSIGYYCYHADMKGKYGNNWEFKPILQHGRWYCVEEYCKLNTPGTNGAKGKNDGILRGWIDGQPAFEKTDIRFRDVDSLKIEEVWVNVYHGGATPVPKEDIHLYLDNMAIARNRVGPVGSTRWAGTWQSADKGPGGELHCLAWPTDADNWSAEFTGFCDRQFAYRVEMKGKKDGEKVRFEGKADLGEKDGGVFSWSGEIAGETFNGKYTSTGGKKGEFQMKRGGKK